MGELSVHDSAPYAPKPTLSELALLFLRLGTISFGGPAAHIGLMEEEVVQRRRWLSREKFLDLLAATNLIPGPNSTEMAIHIGLLAGWTGLFVAGICFILPATIIVTVAAWAYVEYGARPEVSGILYGVKPVIIAVVLHAMWKLARYSVKTFLLAAIMVFALGLELCGMDELVVLLASGLLALGAKWLSQPRRPRLGVAGFFSAALPGFPMASATVTAAVPVGLWPLFLFFLKTGSVLFGSGYVLVAFLRADLVERWHWLTETQLLDAVAVGQVTPGPVFTTATFIGYVLAGLPGAIMATVGIFLPAFFFVAASGPLVPRLRRSPLARAFLDGVVVASVALMLIVTWDLGRAAIVDFTTVALAVCAAVVLLWYRVNSTWLVLGGAAVGQIVSLLG